MSATDAAADALRRQRESEFHDGWARTIRPEELLVDESFQTATAIENQHILQQFGDVRGKRILDYGSGAGEGGVYLAKLGANVVCTDVSPAMLETAHRLAAHHGVSVETRLVTSQQIPGDDREFDFIYGNGVLHHVDQSLARPELARVLKDDGKGCFIEPLPYNPLINAYRHIAKEVRTPDERPLTFADVERFRGNFGRLEHREFWLTALAVFLRFYLVERADPNKERYWKKVYTDAARIEPFFSPLRRMDDWLLGRLPWLGYLCWETVITVSQPLRS